MLWRWVLFCENTPQEAFVVCLVLHVNGCFLVFNDIWQLQVCRSSDWGVFCNVNVAEVYVGEDPSRTKFHKFFDFCVDVCIGGVNCSGNFSTGGDDALFRGEVSSDCFGLNSFPELYLKDELEFN